MTRALIHRGLPADEQMTGFAPDLKRRLRHRELAINSRHDAPAAGLRQKGPVAESVASLEDFSVTDRIVHVPAHIRAGLGKNQKLAEINGGS